MSTQTDLNSQNLLDSLASLSNQNFDNITIIPNQRITIKRAEIESLNNAINALIYNKNNEDHQQLPEVIETINNYPHADAVSLNELKIKVNKDFLRLKNIVNNYDLTNTETLPENISVNYEDGNLIIDITDTISDTEESLYVGIKQVQNTLKIATELLHILDTTSIEILPSTINAESDEQTLNVDFIDEAQGILGAAKTEISFKLEKNKTIDIFQNTLSDGILVLAPEDSESIGMQRITIKPNLQTLDLTEVTRQELVEKLGTTRIIGTDEVVTDSSNYYLGYSQIVFPQEDLEDETYIVDTTDILSHVADYANTIGSEATKISGTVPGASIITDLKEQNNKIVNAEYCLGFGKVEVPNINIFEYTLDLAQAPNITLDNIEDTTSVSDASLKLVSEDSAFVLAKVTVPPVITTDLILDENWLSTVVDNDMELSILPSTFSKTITETSGDDTIETVYTAKSFSGVTIAPALIKKLKTPIDDTPAVTTIEGKSTLYSIEACLGTDIQSESVNISFISETVSPDEQSTMPLYIHTVDTDSAEFSSRTLHLYHIANVEDAKLQIRLDSSLDIPVSCRIFKANINTSNEIIVESLNNALYTIDNLDITNYEGCDAIYIKLNIKDNTLAVKSETAGVESDITESLDITTNSPETTYVDSYVVQIVKIDSSNE